MLATQERVADIGHDVLGEIFRLLAPYQVGGKAITPQTVISDGVTIDSLTVMDMIMELEDRFSVYIPMSLVAEIRTVDQLAGTVLRLHARA